ncbi:MAG TPA: ABC transporter substrate-binding protein [Magnetococcales bacterium]|nr:ABC transporter substrate-binding protein [Magnetococcales bacterium]
MGFYKKTSLAILILPLFLYPFLPHADERQTIQALYLPLADHYAALVAYEKYRNQMTHADFRIQKMKSWPQLRGAFLDGGADMAFIISPLAMDMFRQKPDFHWVSLMHRDGNALAINAQLQQGSTLPENKADRQPDANIALAFKRARDQLGHASVTAVPSLLSTHAVVLYKYLRDHNLELGLGKEKDDADVMAIEVPPAQSIAFIKRENERGVPASFEQSLPWADIVETAGAGHIAWYSKDVLPWPKGHVECIAIAADQTIHDKPAALQEVIYFIHRAAQDIEHARQTPGPEMAEIVNMIRQHVPQHPPKAIIQSLDAALNAINYRYLDVDKPGLKMVMDLAVAAGILKHPIDIDTFADPRFGMAMSELSTAEINALNLDAIIQSRWSSKKSP